MEKVPFHVYAMKEPDYVISLMSTYGTNQCSGWKPLLVLTLYQQPQ